jgi:succinyl-CoA synthetase beta subunit
MLSGKGGMDIEQVAEQDPSAVARLYPNPWRGPLDFELNELIFDAGLGAYARQMVPVIKKLYRAIAEYDAITAEINPLVITDGGRVVAGDAKIETDDNAAFRQRALEERYGAVLEEEGDPYEREAKKRKLTYVSLGGYVGIIGNGAGLCMGTLDLVQRAGGAAANFCDIGGGARAEVVENAMDVILMNPKVRGILVNIFGGITRCDEVARGLIKARDNVGLELPLVVRLSGTNEEEGRQILEQNGIQPGANGWEAAQKIVKLTTSPLAGELSSPRSGEVARSAGGAR